MQHVAVITPPVIPAGWFDKAKAQVGATGFTDDDERIADLLADAIGWLDGPDGYLRRCLMPQTLELRRATFDKQEWQLGGGQYFWERAQFFSWQRWPLSQTIDLPYPPFINLISITYEDQNGADQVLSSSGWRADGDGEVTPTWGSPWPLGRVEADAVRIQYQAGYPLSAGEDPQPTIPVSIRRAVMLLVSHWYNHPDAVVGVENRDSSTEMPLGVRDLLERFRIRRV